LNISTQIDIFDLPIISLDEKNSLLVHILNIHNMKKFIVILILLLMGWHNGSAQITDAEENLRGRQNDTIAGWHRGGVTSLNLAQTSLTNWAAGGQSSFSVNGMFNYFANYLMGETAWDNSISMGYGLQRIGGQTNYIKTDDKLHIMSKYGREAFGDFYYAALVDFRTQFTEGRDYETDTRISDFMAPAYLIGALGLDYKPNNYFSAFFAPVTGRITFVYDQQLANQGAFGVEPGENTRTEFGGYLRMAYTRSDFTPEILQNVSFATKIDLFSNYLEKPQNIDVNWETQISLRVNRFLQVNFNTHLIYDDDIDIVVDGLAASRVQFKQILMVGLSYQF
jgi:hypothetical protein